HLQEALAYEGFAASRDSIDCQAASTRGGRARKETWFGVTSKSSTSRIDRSQARFRRRHSSAARGRSKCPIARRVPSTAKTDRSETRAFGGVNNALCCQAAVLRI